MPAAAQEAPLPVRRVLRHENRRAGIFAPDGEALRQLAQQQQDRRPQADRGVCGDEANAERADGHDDDGERQHLLAPEAIAHDAEEHASQGSHQKRHGKRAERGDGLYGGRSVREEHLAQCERHEAVDAKVKPFHCIAKRRRRDGFLELGVVNDGDVADLQRTDLLRQRGGFCHGAASIKLDMPIMDPISATVIARCIARGGNARP